jgi:hypothetical protein
MSEINFTFIGWCHTDGHDKVWVAFEIENSYYCAWGRRDAKLSFKKHQSEYELNKLIHQKKSKGYEVVDSFLLFSIFPDFKQRVEEELLMKTLSGKIM